MYSIFFIVPSTLYGQRNCYWYLHIGDTLKHNACIVAEQRFGHYQFSKEYQLALDEAILIDSTYAPAYRSKCAAYLKSGDFITWNHLMKQAVKYDPVDNLGDRGWCRFKFFADYKGAINDLLELQRLTEGRINEISGDGYYHLDVVLALCYKAIGDTEQSIQIMQNKLSDDSHYFGLFDFLHLGVMYMELGDFQNAEKYLKLQEATNDLAENRFYIAIAYKYLGNIDGYMENLNLSKEMYQTGIKIFDPYFEMVDKIYLSDILIEEKSGLRQHLNASRGFVLRSKGKR